MITQQKYPVQYVLHMHVKGSLWAMGKYIVRLERQRRRLRLKKAAPPLSVYHKKPKDPKNMDFEILFPVEANEENKYIKKIGGENCAYLRYRGSYKDLRIAHKAVKSYMKNNKLKRGDSFREVYVKRPLFGFLFFIPTMVTDIYFPLAGPVD